MTFLRLFLFQAFGAILFVHAHAQRVPEQGRWALDMDFHLAFSEIKYQYQIPSSGTSVTFNGPYNAKGIQLGGMYVHGALRVGVSATRGAAVAKAAMLSDAISAELEAEVLRAVVKTVACMWAS